MKLNEKCAHMKCPSCGKDMISGVVQSTRSIIFTTEPNGGIFNIKSKDDVVLSSNNFTGPTCLAYICKECEKVVIDYSVGVDIKHSW